MNGPSDEALARLAKMLPDMADGYVQGAIGGKGESVLRYPRYSCPACMHVWGKPWRRILPDARPCKKCKKVLEGGGVILISMDNRFVTVLPKDGQQVNPEFAGKIVRVSMEHMDHLHGLLAKSESPAAGSPPTPQQSPEISILPTVEPLPEPGAPDADSQPPPSPSASSPPPPAPAA